MTRYPFGIDFSHLLDRPHKPVGTNCSRQVAGLVHRILSWEPVTFVSLVAEGMEEHEARSLLSQATALVQKNHGGHVALAARLLALARENAGGVSAAAARAFKEIEDSAIRDSDHLDRVRAKFQAVANGKL